MTFIVIPQRERAIYRFGSTSWLNMRKRNYQMAKFEKAGIVPKLSSIPYAKYPPLDLRYDPRLKEKPKILAKYRRSPGRLGLPLPPLRDSGVLGAPAPFPTPTRSPIVTPDITPPPSIQRGMQGEEGVAVEIRTSSGLGEAVYEVPQVVMGLRQRRGVRTPPDSYMTEGTRVTRGPSGDTFTEVSTPQLRHIQGKKKSRKYRSMIV